MDKEKNYFKELRKKVDIYFVIIISILSSLSVYMLYDKLKINLIVLTIYICLFIYFFSIINDMNSKNITEFDKIIYSANIFSIPLIFTFLFIEINKSLLSLQDIIINILLITSTILNIILLIYRLKLYNKFNNTTKHNIKDKSEEENRKVYSLWDIYTGNFNSEDLKNLKIEDTHKIEHDLFGRDLIIDNLYNSIINSKEKTDCFSIGIVGEWGSGKSTIIELSKNKVLNDKFIIIDDFDPWVIKSQDAIILAMYNTIIENLGKNIGYFKRKKIQNALINISTNIPYIGKGIGSYFENRIDDYSEYKEIKADLEEKLEKSKKRLIFVIDNIDRMNSDNVLFLLTLIGTLFKLPNITYIVAYDKNRIKKIFNSDKIDSKYIEKIINKEIIVPKIHNSDKQYVFYNCLKKCIKNKDEDEDNILKIIASKFENIRDFIRFLNFIIYDINSTFLNKKDFLIIRTIEFLDYKLYKKIYKNKNFSTKRRIALEALDDVGKNFYEQVKASNFFDLLQYLSLKLSNFNIKNNKIEDFSFEYFKSNVLCNKYYFENYFSKSNYTEEYIRIKEYFNYTNIDYEYVKNFFDEDKLYLNNYYIEGLNAFLKEVSYIRTNKNLLIIQLSIYIYFLEKIINGKLNDYDSIYKDIDNEEPSDYIEYTFELEKTFKTIINSSNFGDLKVLDCNIFSSGEFYTFINYHNHITYEIKNDNNVENIEKSKKIIENSNKHISNCKLFIDNKNIAQKNTPQENIQYMAKSLCNLYKETERYRYRYKYK